MSAAELSSGVDTPKGKDKPKGHPWDWCVDQRWCTEKLLEHVHFGPEKIYDPTCGMGNVLAEFADWGFGVVGSDRFDRKFWLEFEQFDFLQASNDRIFGLIDTGNVSIVFNPPYSKQGGKLVRGLAETFIRKALGIATHKVCALLPIKRLSGEARYLFFKAHTPSHVLIFSERPSMPPGSLIARLGDLAWKRGKVDYMWVVWDNQTVTPFGETNTVWIAPRPKEERS